MNVKATKTRILGLTWRKLGSKSDENDENEAISSPRTRSNSVEEKTNAEKPTFTRGLRRMQSVRDALGTLRQKLRTSTRRRKRLINASPYTPKRHASTSTTPSSIQRRSARIAKIQEEHMYSPFNIDTPSKTPSKIRMGTHEPKRYGRYFSPSSYPLQQFNFSSPGQVVRDVNSLTEGIMALTDMSDRLNVATDRRSGIRTTPRVARPTQQRRPVFV